MIRKCVLMIGILVLLAGMKTSTAGVVVPLADKERDGLLPSAGEHMSGEESFLIPDTVFRRYCISFGYADEKGYIIPKEVAKVTWLNVGRMNIKSLEGIKYFTSLEKLICYYTPLVSLDVSGCKALKELYCNHNTSLVSLDVCGCTSLERLYCYNTSLSELDVTGCRALECLRCHDNISLASLDVKGCAALKELYCHNDRLIGMDLSGCVSLMILYCYGNHVAALDATGMVLGKEFRLFCGNQFSDEAVEQTLELTLTARQKVRWDDYQAANGSNARVNVTVK
ncbi:MULTISPECIES: leucine-rich repeat domain-containing protein [Butyricimonas]|uniref:leucine-rich repeat domain-containing protein n=1 Tax=Butyricimonas TaxID=574697 RepID=UPI0007FB24A1|nr:MULTISPECIES: leucine-rich repeat domain-containing protein [Butyricimonas]